MKEEKNYNQLRLDAANLLQLGQQLDMPCKVTSFSQNFGSMTSLSALTINLASSHFSSKLQHSDTSIPKLAGSMQDDSDL